MTLTDFPRGLPLVLSNSFQLFFSPNNPSKPRYSPLVSHSSPFTLITFFDHTRPLENTAHIGDRLLYYIMHLGIILRHRKTGGFLLHTLRHHGHFLPSRNAIGMLCVVGWKFECVFGFLFGWVYEDYGCGHVYCVFACGVACESLVLVSGGG